MPNPSLRSFSARTVLVTGATGFLGRHTVRALLLAGHRVLAIGQDAESAEGLNDWAVDEGFATERFPAHLGEMHRPTAGTTGGSPGGRTVLGWARMDLTDMGSIGVLARALRDVDAIVHCDALTDRWAPADAFERINVGITRHVAMLAQLAKIPRLIHVSSPSVGVAPEAQRQRDEHAAWAVIPHNAAMASRRSAEEALHTLLVPASPDDAADSSALGDGRATRRGVDAPVQVVIVRPQGLVGAGDPSVAPSFLGLARRGWLPVVRRGRALVELTAVENAAQALAHLAITDDPRPFQAPSDVPAHRRVVHPVYHLTNGEPMRVMDLIDGLCLNHGLHPRRVPVPYGLLNRLAGWSEALAERVHQHSLGLLRWNPRLTRYMVTMLGFDHTLSIARAQAWGYAPSVRLGETLHHHTAWSRASVGVSRAEAVRLSLVHAAPLPDVREQDHAQRPNGQRPSVIRTGTMGDSGGVLLELEALQEERARAARGQRTDDRPGTDRWTSVSPTLHEPIDEELHRRMYGSDAAYGSGTLSDRLVWQSATGTDGPHPEEPASHG